MKIEVTDATGLPAWLQSHVSEGQIDLSALPEPEDVSGLKSALEKERANVRAWAKFESPEAIEARLADLETAAKGTGKAAEDAQAKINQIKAEYEEKLNGTSQKLANLMQANARESLKAELAKAGFIPEAIDDIAATAMGRLQFNDDGTPVVMTQDGKPMVGNGADHGATLTDLAKELADAKPYAVRDGGKGGGGKQPGTGGTPISPETKRSTMNHEQKAAYIKEHGSDAYQKLPD